MVVSNHRVCYINTGLASPVIVWWKCPADKWFGFWMPFKTRTKFQAQGLVYDLFVHFLVFSVQTRKHTNLSQNWIIIWNDSFLFTSIWQRSNQDQTFFRRFWSRRLAATRDFIRQNSAFDFAKESRLRFSFEIDWSRDVSDFCRLVNTDSVVKTTKCAFRWWIRQLQKSKKKQWWSGNLTALMRRSC